MFDRRRAEMLGYAALAFVVVFLVVRLLDHASEPAAAPVAVGGGGDAARSAAVAAPGSGAQGTNGTPGRSSPLVVYVAGGVRRPRVHRGARGGRPAGARGRPRGLSSATVAQLDGIDGIGPKLAGRIVQYRDAHGGFRSVEELRQVEGIGAKRFGTLRKALQP